MTNYEWLVKTDKIDNFIRDIHEKDWGELHQKYNIPNSTLASIWLQNEHIYDYKYVIETETYLDPNEERYRIKRVDYNDDDVAQLFKDTTFYDTLDEARAILIKIIEEKIGTNV